MNSDSRNPIRTVSMLTLLAVAMFGFGYLLVPLYDKFCEITGIGGRTGEAVTASVEQALSAEPDLSRLVTVHFDATVNSSLPWRFEPTERKMEVHPGKLYETTYVAYNRSDQPVVAQAVPSVSPGQASLYFNKTECFCFTEQLLGPGESRDMPVRFIVDPNLPRGTSLVTLSYIIYKNDEATAVLAAAP
ncbi:MAG: cytochrome c oxidase assembly protein [Wenzhouxiangella sp.]